MIDVHATDEEHIAWFGSHRVVNKYVTYSMPGVSFGFRVTGCTFARAHISMGQNFFTVYVRKISNTGSLMSELRHYMVTSSKTGFEWITLCTKLNPHDVYEVVVTKRTEKKLRTVFSSFEPVKLEKISVSAGGRFLTLTETSSHNPRLSLRKSIFYPHGWIEIIGDSDACGFGVSGPTTSTSSVFSMDPEMESVELGWGTILANFLKLGPVIIAGTGKGIIANATMCGNSRIPEMYLKECMDNEHYGEPPKAVCVLAGANDFSVSSYPSRERYVHAFSKFLRCIKQARGEFVPIFVFQCSPNCCSSMGSPDVHAREHAGVIEYCAAVAEYTKEAVDAVCCEFSNLHYHTVDVDLNVPNDFGIMMHWNESGQVKIAREMYEFILDRL